MRVPRPRSVKGWIASGLGALAAVALGFFVIAPYNIAASLPHLPGVSWLLHQYMQNAVRTWSAGTERPDWLDLDDPALIRLGAGHFEGGCAPCHGAPGRAPNPIAEAMQPAPPPLEGPAAEYATEELHWLVLNGLKYTGMPAWPSEHRDDEPWALAAFLLRYPELDPAGYERLAHGPVEPAREAPLANARAISFSGRADRLASVEDNCARCHGEDGLGRDGTAPKLAGQSREYLHATLLGYAVEDRPSGIMEPIAAALTPAEMEALAARYAAMPAFGPEPFDPADAALYALGAEIAGRGTDDVPSCLACHGDGLTPPRKPLYPAIGGQTRRFLTVWLHLWRERDWGATEFSHLMHAAARPLDDRQIEALAVFFAAGGPAAETAAVQPGARPAPATD